jgi:hypothetical protein
LLLVVGLSLLGSVAVVHFLFIRGTMSSRMIEDALRRNREVLAGEYIMMFLNALASHILASHAPVGAVAC